MTDTENTPPSADKVLRRFVKADRRLKRRIAKLNEAHKEWVEAYRAVEGHSTDHQVGMHRDTIKGFLIDGPTDLLIALPETHRDMTDRETFYKALADDATA
ncbi:MULTISPECIES: hypothetical protein [unclassified Cellulosimicrobium]|uniref:hypothetical protein n=1 Tax=Cellulosimicrobium sp. SL-1 TaxID=2699423 RepID=UPI0004E2D2D0|nr:MULTISPECIES: hypothetical protein [unclassified Cellulosimicrobium]KFD43143.1 hypothetical protein IU11_13945 [Cellulosimicrobium sp. MM]